MSGSKLIPDTCMVTFLTFTNITIGVYPHSLAEDLKKWCLHDQDEIKTILQILFFVKLDKGSKVILNSENWSKIRYFEMKLRSQNG